MQNEASTVVILGTGGTIAGSAASAGDHVGYTAGQIGIEQLVSAVPSLAGVPLECEQLAQLDSKDMDFATWQRLARRIDEVLRRRDVQGIVVTHGTDTLEETAYFLHRVLAPCKPVVLTAAMRPATALSADGPQNLRDAVTVAQAEGARGVCAVLAGTVFHPVDLRKTHTYRVDAFAAGDAGPIGRIEQDRVRRFRDWGAGDALGVDAIARDAAAWPRVEIVLNHVSADGRIVDALLAQGIDGLVVAGTGNGAQSVALASALERARTAGVGVMRASRCAQGPVIGADDEGADELSAVQARVALLLQLLEA